MSDLVPMQELSPAVMSSEIVRLELEKKAISTKLEGLKKSLLVSMKDLDVLTLKTGAFTVTRAVRKTYKVESDEAAINYLKGLGHEVVTKTTLDMDYMKPLVADIIEHDGGMEGVELQATEYVAVRVNKKEESV